MLLKKPHNIEMERRSINVQLKSQGSVEEAMDTYKPEAKANTTLSEEGGQRAHREKKLNLFSKNSYCLHSYFIFSAEAL